MDVPGPARATSTAWCTAAATTRTGRWSSSARACTRLTGYAPEDLLLNGRVSYEELTHPEDRAARPRRDQRRGGAASAGSRSSTASSTPTGECAGCGSAASGVRDSSGRVIAIEGIVEDITARVESEQALREAERRYRSLFDNAIEGIFRTTPDGQLSRRKSRARAHLRFRDSTTSSLTRCATSKTQLYVDPERREEFMRIIKARGEISGFESQVYRKNGDVIWISENARAVFDDEGRVLHYEGTVEDVTERQLNQARIEHQANHDALTGLANRSLLSDRLVSGAGVQWRASWAAGGRFRRSGWFQDGERQSWPRSGRQLLRKIAGRLEVCVRASDTVARFGGDEFVLVLSR